MSRLRDAARRLAKKLAGRRGSAAYWTSHLVVDETFTTAEASLRYFNWRNAQYAGYIDLMPVSGQDGRVVLDYGCGPGNDLVGFAVHSTPARLIGADVSPTALARAKARLAVHGAPVELLQISEGENAIPLPAGCVDYIHTSGVLHHCANLPAVLAELRRVMKPDGRLAVMVYNYNSIWLHLNVAWMQQIALGLHAGLAVRDAFQRTTDGPDCPVSRCYTPAEFVNLMSEAGFTGTCVGAAISLNELQWLARRYEALADRRLGDEHRDFLAALTFDVRGIPLHAGVVAGIDACYQFVKTE